MDPKACYLRILNALAKSDSREAFSAIKDYETWLSNGGFSHLGATEKGPDFVVLVKLETLTEVCRAMEAGYASVDML